jgi:spore germination protein YaaH
MLVVPASAVGVTTSPHLHVTTTLAITAFQEEGDPNSLITRSAKSIATVGVDGVDTSADGSQVSTPDATARASLRVAHADGLLADFLVSNWDNHINDFSEAYAHRLLDSTDNIDAVAAALAHSVDVQGWDGVSIDLESLHQRDEAGLVTFLQTLRADLPVGKTLSVCVSSYASPAAYPATGYNLAGIAAAVDEVILMAYDEHGSWENQPGPVGALSWQKAGLRAALRYVPAAKLDLGQAGYGYAWRPHSNETVSDAQARRMVARNHVAPRFNAKVGEWTAHLPDGSTLWWADARSFRLRVALAQHDGLHGMAMWDLGLSDPISATS